MIIVKGKKKWARKFKKCIKCGTDEKPHRQEGYCVTCWAKKRYKKERAKYLQHFKNYYIKNKKL